jgi:small subunit ribosomal protein S2
MRDDGRWDLLSKKEQSKLDKVYRKLSKNLGGIKSMIDLPGVLFIIDSTKEEIAILEAMKLNIPVVAVVDTNGDPDNIDYPIPGNDDAVRAIELFASKVSEAIVEGKKERIEKELLEEKKEPQEETKEETKEEIPPEAEQTPEEVKEFLVQEEPEVPKEPEASE